MSFNRGDIRADARRRLNEFVTTVIDASDIKQEFDNAIRDIEQRIDFKELQTTDSTLVTVADQQEYTLTATNIRKIIDLVEDPTGDKVQYSEIDFNDRLNRNSLRGVSLGDSQVGNTYYLFGTDTIGLNPIPNTSGRTLKFYYQKFHPAITDDTTALSLPDIVREAIVTFVTSKVLLADETIPNATMQLLDQEYDMLVGKARSYIESTSNKRTNQLNNY